MEAAGTAKIDGAAATGPACDAPNAADDKERLRLARANEAAWLQVCA